MKIVFLDAYTSNPGDLSWDGLKQLGECIIYDRSTPEQIVERSREADAILINKVIITREMMEQLPKLRYIGILATGFNELEESDTGQTVHLFQVNICLTCLG